MTAMHRSTLALLLTLTLLMSVPLASHAQDARPTPTGRGRATPVATRAAITTQPLATIRLPAAAIPPSPAIVDVWLATLTPGQELGFATGASPPSIVVDVVLSGALLVLSQGRVQVQRAAGLEEVAPATVVTIHPGEAVIYVDNQAAQTFRNPGRSPLTALSFGVFSAAAPSTFTAGPVSQEDWARTGLAGHDLTVTVVRLTVPPGARLPAFVPDVQMPRIFAVAAGVAQAVILTPSGATPPPAERVGPGQVLRFRTLGAGERLQLHNPEAQPLVLLQVTLSADQSATPVAEPPRPRKWPVSAPEMVPSRSQGAGC
jgi:mannose-6-phosphate isomerase-like protein (cupin superfamily)